MMALKTDAKMDALKELVKQMQMLMAEGEGDSEEAGEESLDAVADAAKEAPKAEEAVAEESGELDEIKQAVRDAFKGKPAAPAKGAMVVMQSKTVMPKKMDKFEALKKNKKGVKYG